jgi:hypothetical protein
VVPLVRQHVTNQPNAVFDLIQCPFYKRLPLVLVELLNHSGRELPDSSFFVTQINLVPRFTF